MADSRLLAHWHSNPDFDDLSDTAWRVFTGALMWSNGRGTDGHVPTRYVRSLHPDGPQPEACDELESAHLWKRSSDGYQLLGWVESLGQSTAEQVEHNKEVNRQKQARYRAEQKKKLSRLPSFSESDGDVTSEVTGYVTADVGKDRDRDRDRAGTKDLLEVAFNEKTGEIEAENNSTPRKVESWVVAPIPTGKSCRACLTPLAADYPLSVCAKQDDEHAAARKSVA
jgi:hypothetical protein